MKNPNPAVDAFLDKARRYPPNPPWWIKPSLFFNGTPVIVLYFALVGALVLLKFLVHLL
jgi:hypothetical protein